MARTLSRIAQLEILLFTAGAGVISGACAVAQSTVQVAPASEIVDNPFTARGAQQPTSAVVPLESATGPRVFQNPFAARYASPPPDGTRSRGSLSRWRQPVPLPEVANPTVISNPYPTTSTPGQVTNPNWDQLSPTDLNGDQISQLLPPEDPNATNSRPPDPARFATRDLQQPPWLKPESPDNSDIPTTESGHSTGLAGDLRKAGALARKNTTISIIEPKAPEPPKPPATPTTPADPMDAAGWCAQAKVSASQAKSVDDFAEVVRDCRQGTSCRPSPEEAASLRSLAAWACNRRGELESEGGQEVEALREFEAAIVWDPNCWLALHNRAVSRAEQGQSAAALADFNRVLELNPGLAVAYRNRGELLAAMGRTEEAVADYNRAIEQMPQDADLRTMRGDAFHRLGQYPEALVDLNKSIELAPQRANSYIERGNVYAEIGDFDRAARDFRQSLHLDPNCAEAFRSVAWLLATCPDQHYRDPQKAIVAAEQAARLSSANDPFVLEALAAANAASGQFDRAVRFQTEAVSYAPDGFSDQFAARLALYQQHRPFRNDASARPTRQAVRQAKLEVGPPLPSARSTIRQN